MRIAFMGTPDFAVPTLDALLEAGHEVAAVYTQPPRPGGRRGRELTPSPVQRRAEAAGIEVRTPLSLRDAEEQARFRSLGLEAAVVAAYGLILPVPILEAPRWGCLNVHGSILPRWRGAAPVQRAILAGDEVTGVTVMEMEKGLDTGPMLLVRETPIGRKTAGELTAELAEMGAAMMVEALAAIETLPRVVQPETGVTYAHKIEKAEARLDFILPAEQLERQVRAFAPSPGAFFELDGERIKVLEARVAPPLGGDPGMVADGQLTIACLQDALWPSIVQRPGRAPLATEDFLRGKPVRTYTYLDGYPAPGWE
ncbi:MAG TPA: methionyl-tRNA formyltransferase [Allosphingosinicella sp.]|jgi:methionyl-tRNA formyltransferase